jgi:hypothetical protein
MQRSTLTAIAAAAFVAGAVGVQTAKATSTRIRSVPVATANENGVPGAGAATDDASLLTRVINVMEVTVPAGQDWTGGRMRIELTSGSIYNAAPPAGTEGAPSPTLWPVTGFRNGAYDTFVNDRNNTTTFLLGSVRADGTDGPPEERAGLAPGATNLLSVVWVNTTLDDTGGPFKIGQFTLSNDATGRFFGSTLASDAPGSGDAFSGTIVAGSMGGIIPEPTGLAAVLLTCTGLLARRRRRVA